MAHAGVLIIGAGQAAARAAKAMRLEGFQDPITMFGAEPHLPYERPILSKGMILDPDTPMPHVLAPGEYEALDIQVETGIAISAIDRGARSVRLSDHSRRAYDQLLLATGSRVRTLSIPGVAPRDISYLRTVEDARALAARLAHRPSVAIIGGGFIGLEVAASAAGLGCRVTVVETAGRLLPRLGCAEASALVLAHHASVGVDVRLSCSVLGGANDELVLSDGTTVSADVILAGIGVAPETALAEQAGLEVEDGVVVDEFGRTSDPLIFAAGDVARHYNPAIGRALRLESWENANLQAAAVGRGLAGRLTSHGEIPWLWSDQGLLNLQVAGAPDVVTGTIVRSGVPEEGLTVFQMNGDRLVGAVTVNRGKDMVIARRLIAQRSLALSPAILGDTSVPLKRFLQSRQHA